MNVDQLLYRASNLDCRACPLKMRCSRRSQRERSRAASTKTLATSFVPLREPKPSSAPGTIESASRCCSLTSSASSGWVASGCAAHAARKTSSPSRLLRKTCAVSPKWSLGRHQRPPLAPHKRCWRQGDDVNVAPPGTPGASQPSEEPLKLLTHSNRQLLQQNRHFCEAVPCPHFGRFRCVTGRDEDIAGRCC